MFKWLFGKRCEHDYEILREWRRYVIYYPKCDKEKRVDAKQDISIRKGRKCHLG